MPSIAVVISIVLAAAAANAAEPLFPQPLHLTREIEDPVTGRTAAVEEFFSGNRAVSIAGELTVIVDYSKGESLRIDRVRGTWSVATLDAVARAARAGRPRAAAAVAEEWNVRATGSERRGAREVTVYRAAAKAQRETRPRVDLEIAIDRSVALTRAGAEVIAGAAYPNERSPEAEAILRAAGGEGTIAASTVGGAAPVARFGLPLETIVTWREGDEEIRFVNRIVRVGIELAPGASLEIPRGARKVEDPRVAVAALLEALDQTAAPKE